MALHLRPWNTNFVKLCSLRYCALSTSMEGANSKEKVTDIAAQVGHDNDMHEVDLDLLNRHVPKSGPAVSGQTEQLPFSMGRSSPGLSQIPVGSRLYALLSETRKLGCAVLPAESTQTLPVVLPKPPPAANMLCWHSEYEVETKEAAETLPESGYHCLGSEVNHSSLRNVPILDQLFLGNMLQPVSYTGDDIHLDDMTNTGFPKLKRWKSCDDLPTDFLKEYQMPHLSTVEDCNGTNNDIITKDNVPVIMIPFKTLDILGVRSAQCCDKFDSGVQTLPNPVKIRERLLSESAGDVVEYLCSSESTPDVNSDDGPSLDTLLKVKDAIEEEYRLFFVKLHNYHLYHKDVIFENNFYGEGKVHQGINAYAWEMNKIKMGAHFKFANVKFHILKITHHEEDYTVKVRWRVNGLPTIAAFFKFWKFFPGQFTNSVDKESEWHDGFSVFYLNKDGLIVKHKVDRLIEDMSRVETKKTGLAGTLAVLIGLMPRPSMGDLNAFMMKGKKPSVPPLL